MKLFTLFSLIILAMSLSLFGGGKTGDSSSSPMGEEMMSSLLDFKDMDDAMMMAESNTTVLFFHARWCPSCKAARKDFESNSSELKGVNLIIVDYDSSSDLKKKYNVTYQHTFVQISPSGEAIVKWNGGGTEELLANIVKSESE